MCDEYRAGAALSLARSKGYSHGRAAYGIEPQATKPHTRRRYHKVSGLETAGNSQIAVKGFLNIL